MRTTVITRKGQVTIPSDFRQALGISEGDRLEVVLNGDTVCLRRAESVIDRTAGIFADSGPALSAEQLREAAETAIAEEGASRSRQRPPARRDT
jgi:AbrB family looped-hinge helix DNA binding protein